MKFDIVIGNPPYNNDIYIPFVELGHQLSTEASVFITPAKWQAKGDRSTKDRPNDRFRNNIVPYISKIVYYPNSEDVFNIWLTCGICYYLVNKEVCNNKYIKNICNTNQNINGEIYVNKRNIRNIYIWRSILEKIYDNKDEKIGIDKVLRDYTRDFYDDGTIIVKMNWALSWGGLLTKGDTFVTEPSEVTENSIVEKTSSSAIWFKGSKEECTSFKSYIDTRFIRFLLFNFISGQSISADIFRFIPDPGAFDHIFTDEELYKKYNLTDEEINIIESVIKERK